MSDSTLKKGGISVETEHIFPVIKKWLYSDKDIFLREIVSNACDAITKMKRLGSLGHTDITDDYRIDVVLNRADSTITVSDNGIGMTAEELDKYLCSIALSGALDFISKYEGKDSENDGIIGHFGLGFYSSFMVSDTVTVISRSYTDAPAVKWTCSESGEYTLESAERSGRGTDVIMHITDEELEYISAVKLKEILGKYCSFMPAPIYFTDEKGVENVVDITEEEENADDRYDDKVPKETDGPVLINDVNPLWMKNPSECTDEEYKSFYTKITNDFNEPLFWIHINADYPLNFKGILYFPKITNEYEPLNGQVKLYYNQVFVADNVKEVIPDFLLMLKGVIDCPELPLNVSRSYLQDSGHVQKISKHIVKKVADKLNSLFNNERENYEKIWNDLKIFVEYGSLKEPKFYEKIKDSVLYELTDGKHETLPEYLEKAKGKHENIVYYCKDKTEQARYISMLQKEEVEIMLFDRTLDNQFISMIEQNEKDVSFKRVDAAVADILKGDGEKFESDKLREALVKASGNEKLSVKFENLKDETVPAVLTVDEQGRRFGEMMKLYGMDTNGNAPDGELIVNSNCESIRKIAEKLDNGEDCTAYIRRVWQLAVLAQRRFTPEELGEFLSDSYGELLKTL